MDALGGASRETAPAVPGPRPSPMPTSPPCAGRFTRRRPAGRRRVAGRHRDQVPHPVHMVAAALFVGDALETGPQRGAGSRRGQPRRRLRRGAAVEIRALQHADLPRQRALRRGPAEPRGIHDRESRPALRHEERVRPRPISRTDAAGPGALAAPDDRLRGGRPGPRHLLVADRAGVPAHRLSDSAVLDRRSRTDRAPPRNGPRTCTSGTIRSSSRVNSVLRHISM